MPKSHELAQIISVYTIVIMPLSFYSMDYLLELGFPKIG